MCHYTKKAMQLYPMPVAPSWAPIQQEPPLYERFCLNWNDRDFVYFLFHPRLFCDVPNQNPFPSRQLLGSGAAGHGWQAEEEVLWMIYCCKRLQI